MPNHTHLQVIEDLFIPIMLYEISLHCEDMKIFLEVIGFIEVINNVLLVTHFTIVVLFAYECQIHTYA